MSLLARLLKAKDPYFTMALKELEALTGRPGVDTALIGEILSKGFSRAGELGLSPDFNGKELYYSLVNRVQHDDERLAKKLGGSDPTSLKEMLPLLVKTVEKAKLPRTGWFMKAASAKKMLKAMPPRQVMKRLGYARVDTMLARENWQEIYGALRFAEDPDWLNRFLAQYKSLTFKDFEHRDIKFVQYNSAKWGDVAAKFIRKKKHNITHLKELGVIMTMPTGEVTHMPGVTLKVLPLLIHYVNEIRLYSAFFKLVSVKKNFGAVVANTLIADPAHVSVLAGRHLHWRVIQRYFGKSPRAHHPEIFEPHVQPEDLHWRKAEDVLYKLDPQLAFWRGLDFVALEFGREAVSFNLMDVALSYSNGLTYEKRYVYHFREALWNEIFMRYMGQKALESQILERLDNELISPDKIMIAGTKRRTK